MSKQYYAENLSIETLAELTDEMLRFKKNAENRKLNLNLLKIIPAAALVMLVIGLINALAYLPFSAGAGGKIPEYIVIKGERYSTELTELVLECADQVEYGENETDD